MQAEHVAPFVDRAFDILTRLTQARPQRGSPLLRSGGMTTTRELTAVVAVEGDLRGLLYCSMSLATAAKLQSAPGAETPPLGPTALVESIAAAGLADLAAAGYTCEPRPAVLVEGFGEPLTSLSPVLLIPVYTLHGDLDLGLTLQPAAGRQSPVTLITTPARARRDPASAPAEMWPVEDLAPTLAPSAPPAGDRASRLGLDTDPAAELAAT